MVVVTNLVVFELCLVQTGEDFQSVDVADYHRYYDGRVAVICSDLLVVLGRIYDEVRG